MTGLTEGGNAMAGFAYLLEVGRYLFAAFLAFCLGGVLFSYHLPKLLKNIDIRKESPDHNPGTVNAFRCAGVPVGVLCLLCDLAKGFLPVFFFMRLLDSSRLWFALILCAPVLGHAIAPLYHHRGGKAIAASFGALLGLLPQSFLAFLLAALYIFFSIVLVINPHERRTVVTFGLFCCLSLASALYTGRWSFCLGAALLSITVIVKNYRDAKLEAGIKLFRHSAKDDEPKSADA